jgi:hypothetical protein
MTKPPTAKDWVSPETDEDWERHSKQAAKRMGLHDSLPRPLRVALHELGELSDHQMRAIMTNLNRNEVSVIIAGDRKFIIKPEGARFSGKQR